MTNEKQIIKLSAFTFNHLSSYGWNYYKEHELSKRIKYTTFKENLIKAYVLITYNMKLKYVGWRSVHKSQFEKILTPQFYRHYINVLIKCGLLEIKKALFSNKESYLASKSSLSKTVDIQAYSKQYRLKQLLPFHLDKNKKLKADGVKTFEIRRSKTFQFLKMFQKKLISSILKVKTFGSVNNEEDKSIYYSRMLNCFIRILYTTKNNSSFYHKFREYDYEQLRLYCYMIRNYIEKVEYKGWYMLEGNVKRTHFLNDNLSKFEFFMHNEFNSNPIFMKDVWLDHGKKPRVKRITRNLDGKTKKQHIIPNAIKESYEIEVENYLSKKFYS